MVPTKETHLTFKLKLATNLTLTASLSHSHRHLIAPAFIIFVSCHFHSLSPVFPSFCLSQSKFIRDVSGRLRLFIRWWCFVGRKRRTSRRTRKRSKAHSTLSYSSLDLVWNFSVCNPYHRSFHNGISYSNISCKWYSEAEESQFKILTLWFHSLPVFLGLVLCD